ncbi:P-loop NTPase fold protein [Actinomadura sp. NPDC048032]|uniref:P-loop NTPase fold protein n=1 Tax=Actinomadura sp. NPDC048032 TaxID=3155747 RepID=UPI00340B2653
MSAAGSPSDRPAVIAEFIAELERVRGAAGDPSWQGLSEVIFSNGGVEIPERAIADTLTSKSVPSWEFVANFVNACQVYAGRIGVTDDDLFDLERWRARYEDLRRNLTQEPSQPEPSTTEPGEQPTAPSSLPPEPVNLAGREDELHRLASRVEDAFRDGAAQTPILIGGTGGVGKTALATRAAHYLTSYFPDGSHFVAFHAEDGEQNSIAETLDDLLAKIGTPAGDIPSTLPEQYRLLRDQLESRRLLLVLDDVPDPEIVKRLTDGEGPARSLVIATTRKSVRSRSWAETLDLSTLDEPAALELLRRVAGTERIEAEPEAAAEIVRLCDALPLALMIVAGRLSIHPDWSVADLAVRLRTAKADAGTAGRAAFDGAYQDLGETAARVLRTLGLVDDHEPEEVPLRLISFLAEEMDPGEISQAVQRLTRSALAETSPDGETVRVHRLVRAYARERAEAEDPPVEVAAIRERARRFFLLDRGYQSRPEPLIATDLWTLRDRLDHSHLVEAIAAFLRHPQTGPPLTIGLKAPWGAGKTSLMRMLQNELDPRDGGRPCRVRLDGPSRARLRRFRPRRWPRGRGAAEDDGVTNREVLRQANAPAAPAPLNVTLAEDAPLDRDAWRPTVWFNPWMYQNGEQVWAGLAHEIITQVTERLPAADRERFWLRLNLARVDRGVVRRRAYRLVAERLLPLLAVWAVAVVVILAGLAVGRLAGPVRGLLDDAVAPLIGGGTLALLGAGAWRTLAFLGGTAAGPFSALVRKPDLLGGGHRLLAGEMKAGFDKLVPDPGYAGRLGFLHLIQSDMKRVLDLIATEERPLVVFVDDLDRCSPGTVTQVIEAINLFLAGEFRHCVFVLGMEPGVVAAHVEAAYQDLARAQRDGRLAGDWSTLGWRFLEKIVQLPLSVPGPGEAFDGYLRSLTEPPAPRGGARTAAPPPERPVSRRRRGPLRRSPSAPAPPAPAPPAAGPPRRMPEGAPPPDGGDNAGERPDPRVVAEIEAGIRARRPTPQTLRETALAVQAEVLGLPAPLRPAALTAASRVVSDLYSDTDAYSALSGVMAVLPSRNPREIKRFVNLFRFYSFIAERQRLLGVAVPSQSQIAKLAAFAIRWPHVVSLLGAAGPGHPLVELEKAARDDDDAWRTALAEAFPVFKAQEPSPESPSPAPAVPSEPPPGWGDDLRAFLTTGEQIGEVAARYL